MKNGCMVQSRSKSRKCALLGSYFADAGAKLTIIMVTMVFLTSFCECAALCASLPPANSTAQSAVQELYRDAHNAFQRGDYIAAAHRFRELLKLLPNSPQVWNDLGVAYSMAGRREAAVQAFQHALRLDPSFLPANLMLGIDLVRLGKAEEAIPLFERVHRQRPSNRNALSDLASAFFATHQFDKAAEAYRRETLLPGKDSKAWYGLGLCFEHIAEEATQSLRMHTKESAYYHELVGQFLTNEDTDVRQQSAGIDALSELRRALEVSGKDDIGFHASLGFAQLRLGEISKAAQEFNQELHAYPGSLDGKLGVAEVELAKRDFHPAVHSLCKIYLADQGFYESHLDFLVTSLGAKTQSVFLSYLEGTQTSASCDAPAGMLKKNLSPNSAEVRLDGAFESLSQVAKGRHSDGSSLIIKAHSDFATGHYTLCMQNLAGFARRSAQNSLMLSQCAFLSGHFLVAFDAATSLLAQTPESVSGIYWRAQAAKKLSQSAFQTAVSLSPNSWEGHVLLGDIYVQRKRWSFAISEYQAAEKLMPESPAPYLGLGTVYWRTGRNRSASTVLLTALRLDPENTQANFEMGDILVREHHFDKAVPYLRRTVRDKPNFLPAHADLGKIYLASGDVHKAMVEILKALPMDRSGNLHYQLYLVYKKQGLTKQAQQALAESQKLRASALKTHQKHLEKAFHLTKKPADEQP